jgi:hypothetical protein
MTFGANRAVTPSQPRDTAAYSVVSAVTLPNDVTATTRRNPPMLRRNGSAWGVSEERDDLCPR